MTRAGLLFLALASAVAADPHVEPRIAFGGAAREGSWTAVRVEIQNPDAEAKLTLRIEGDGAWSVRDIVVPAGSRHGYWMPVRSTHSMNCEAIWKGNNLLAIKDKDGKVVKDSHDKPMTLELKPSLADANQRLLLVVGDSSLGLPSSALWRIELIAPAELPDFSDAYDAFDAVVIRFPCPGLPDEAAEAIHRWTLAGGVLAVCAGVDAKSAAQSRLGSALPAEISGTIEVTSLGDIDPNVATPSAPFPVAAARPRPGAMPAPFGATGPAGLGRAIFLGFDPLLRPVSDWAGMGRFWRIQLPLPPNPEADAVLPESEKERRIALSEGRREAAERLKERMQQQRRQIEEAQTIALSGKAIALGWFFALLIAYLVVIGPVDYYVLKAIRRQSWTWVTLPLAIVAFCAAAWGMSARTKARDAHIVAIGTIDVWPDAVRESAVYMVVAPLPGEQDIMTASADARLWPAFASEKPYSHGLDDDVKPLPEIAWGLHPAAQHLQVGGWEGYPVAATTDLPPGAYSVTMNGDSAVVRAPGLLRSCRLCTSGAPRDLGDLKSGETVPEAPLRPATAFEADSFEEAAAAFLLKIDQTSGSGVLRASSPTRAQPILEAWIDRPAAEPTIGGEAPARVLFLVRFHLEKAP